MSISARVFRGLPSLLLGFENDIRNKSKPFCSSLSVLKNVHNFIAALFLSFLAIL